MTGELAAPVAGRYQIVRLLGEGKLGEVFEVKDLRVGERVALKRIRAGLLDEQQAAGLRRALALTRTVTHPNVCRVFDVGSDAGQLFWTMELVSGGTLAERLRERGKPRRAARRSLARQLAAGLDAAHDAGLAHGSLRAANVLIAEGERAVISDFGVDLDDTTRASDARAFADLLAEIGLDTRRVPPAARAGALLAAAERATWWRAAAAVAATLVLGVVAGGLLMRTRVPSGYQLARGCGHERPVRVELFADRAAFLRAVADARTVGFDDIDTSGPEPVAFAADRYRAAGILIRAPGGQYVDDDFSQSPPQALSPPNAYAAGPPGAAPLAPRATEVTFWAGVDPACTSAFGVEFLGALYAGPDLPAIAVYDAAGRELAAESRFTSAEPSLFRGFVARDAEGRATPVMARARVVAGNRWPLVRDPNGVSIGLDDLSFAPPAPSP